MAEDSTPHSEQLSSQSVHSQLHMQGLTANAQDRYSPATVTTCPQPDYS